MKKDLRLGFFELPTWFFFFCSFEPVDLAGL